MLNFFSLFSALGDALYIEEKKMKYLVGGAFSEMALLALPSYRRGGEQALWQDSRMWGCAGTRAGRAGY